MIRAANGVPSRHEMIEACMVGYAITIDRALRARTPVERAKVEAQAKQNRKNMARALNRYTQLE